MEGSLVSLHFLPTFVNDAYRRLLDRALDQEFVLKVLSWIYHARRPLRMGELREAVNVEIGDKVLNRNLTSADALIESCQGLVIWERSDRLALFKTFEFLYGRQTILPSSMTFQRKVITRMTSLLL